MLFISGKADSYCPYRDCLGIDTNDGRVSWYQLLGVSQASSPQEMQHRYERRRLLVLKNRQTTSHPVWDNLLDELDRAIAVLVDPNRKREYDEDLLRRNRQVSLIRLPEKEAEDWQAMMPAEKLRRANHGPEKRKGSGGGQKTSPGPRETYEPLRTVGEGPFGTRVYEAWEFRLNRRVAVRCLLRPARTTERQQLFVDEAQFLASVSHPNLVEVHTVNPRSCFMVMEYLEKTVPGFQEEHQNRQCPQDFVIRFLTQGLSVLKRLHDAGIVHGAVGRRSFHLTEQGDLKLVDAPGCTMGGLFRTPRPDQTCVAPELLSPEAFGDPGPTSDLYMLGFAAFELLAGDQIQTWIPKLMGKSDSEQQVWMQWHASPMERLPDVQSLVPGISLAVATVIETLCEKQVADRFRSAEEALGVLQAADPIPNSAAQNPVTIRQNQMSHRGGSRLVGGEAPLIHEARRIEQRNPDLLEMLQDPALLWQQLRSNRRYRMVGGAACFMMMIMFVLWSVAPEVQTIRITDKKNVEQNRSMDNTDLEINLDSSAVVSAEMPVEEVVENSKTPMPTRMAAASDDLELAAVPISLDTLGTNEDVAPVRESVQLPAVESVTPFPLMLVQQSDYSSYLHILRQLRIASTVYDRNLLFAQAKKLAPKDPRTWYLYAAANGFSEEYRDSLRTADELSKELRDVRYSQPLRQMIECRVKDIDRTDAKAADETIAWLLEFSSRIVRNGNSSECRHDWEWIGRVLGVLEMKAKADERISGMLTMHRSRILSFAGSEETEAIQRGQAYALQILTTSSEDGLFPNHPQISYGLCLSSFREPQRFGPDEHSSKIARRQN